MDGLKTIAGGKKEMLVGVADGKKTEIKAQDPETAKHVPRHFFIVSQKTTNIISYSNLFFSIAYNTEFLPLPIYRFYTMDSLRSFNLLTTPDKKRFLGAYITPNAYVTDTKKLFNAFNRCLAGSGKAEEPVLLVQHSGGEGLVMGFIRFSDINTIRKKETYSAFIGSLECNYDFGLRYWTEKLFRIDGMRYIENP